MPINSSLKIKSPPMTTRESEKMENKFPEIETSRLILRKVKSDDKESMFKYLSDEDVVKHMGLFPYKTAEEVMDEINWYDSIYKEGTGIRWGITEKGKNEVIGSCGFLNMKRQHFRAEIGFELNKEYWSQGIAGEAISAVLQYGFQSLGLERIEALIEPTNRSSQKLVEKYGFIKEGLLRHYEFTCGKFDDLLMYSILKEDLVGIFGE